MIERFKFMTRIGPFFITEQHGWFNAVFDSDSLGSYSSPEQAADDLAGGHTFSISNGVDTATLGIPEDLAEWEKLKVNEDTNCI